MSSTMYYDTAFQEKASTGPEQTLARYCSPFPPLHTEHGLAPKNIFPHLRHKKNADFPFGKPTLEAYPAPIRLREKIYYIFTIS